MKRIYSAHRPDHAFRESDAGGFPCRSRSRASASLPRRVFVNNLLRRSAWLPAFGALLAPPAPAADLDSADKGCASVAETVEVAPGHFVRAGRDAVVFEGSGVANIGFVVGERCVAVIDTGGSEAEGRALDCAVRAVTPRSVCYVINTHVHPDHLLGNRAFQREGVIFIGHSELPRALALVGATYLERARAYEGRPLSSDYLVPPTETVRDETVIDLGGRALRLVAHRSAHSTTDLTVWDSSTSTLWTGDLVFVRHVPVVAASLLGWLEELEQLRRVPARRIVPGHGHPALPWPEAGSDTHRYLITLRDEIRVLLKGRADLADAQAQIGYSEKGKWSLFESYHRRNIAAAFAELEWED